MLTKDQLCLESILEVMDRTGRRHLMNHGLSGQA